MRRYSPFIVSAAAVVLFYAVILTVYFTCVHTPKAETAPDNVGEVTEEFDADAQREAYLSAVEKAGSMSFRQYSEKMTSLVTYPDHQDSDSFSGSFKEINRGKDDPRYYASVTHGEDTFECWYLGGTGYSDESGEKLKSPAEEGDFAEYIDGRVFLALGEDFYTLDAVKNDDGTCSVTFDGLSRVPDEVSRMYYDMGMTGVKISGFSGKAEIDDKGRLSDQSIVLKLSMTRAGENVTAEYRSEISFENPVRSLRSLRRTTPNTGRSAVFLPRL
jgi:hypothetical protein